MRGKEIKEGSTERVAELLRETRSRVRIGGGKERQWELLDSEECMAGLPIEPVILQFIDMEQIWRKR